MNTCMLIILAALATVVCAPSPTTAAASTCPWRTVSNIDYKYVQGFGRWAVEQQNAHLNFDKVVSATAQAVGDCLNDMNRNYALNILASRRNGAGDDKFKAVVYVEREIVPVQLISFKSVRGFAASGQLSASLNNHMYK